MGAIDVGVRHDDDLVVAGTVDREARVVVFALSGSDSRSDRRDQGPDFLVVQDLVDCGLLGIDQLSAQGKDGLVASVAALLGGAAGRVALDDVELRQGRIALGTVGQLAGQPAA